jgi:hypothetical protein
MNYNSQTMLSASQEKQLADGIEDGFLENDWFCDFSDNENDEREKENVPMAPKTEFVPLNSGIEGEEGQNSKEWSDAMDSFGSRKVYQDRMTDFLQHAQNDNSERSLEMKLVKYFDDSRQLKNNKGEDRYRATSFRSWHSVFCKFWKFCKFRDLKTEVPGIEDRISKWEKMQCEAKQAKVLTAIDLFTYYDMINTPENLVDKIYAVMAMSFAARGVESSAITWNNVTKSIQVDTGETQIKVTYLRTKQKGIPEQSYTLITGEIEVRILNEYQQCFKPADRNGRYFRVLKYGADGTTIIGMNKNIGHNTTAKAGIRIATRLGLEDPELCTGHTFRRSAATICAESGMTLPEIKLVTGKKTKQNIRI